MSLAPFNVTIINPDEYIRRRGLLPVTSHAMFETSTNRFHPDGLYSEAIFGQVGSRDRLIRRGYIDLHTTVISPHLYKQLMTLKGFYKEVVSGKSYAVMDKDLHDLVKTNMDDPEGNTGYSFFLKSLPNIKFQETDSQKRHDKIALLDKFQDELFMTKLIVLPAGVRDVKESNGRYEPEEINKIYLHILSLTQALPEGNVDDPTYDAIRYQLQMKIQELYEYIYNLLDGKFGFMQGKYTRRAVAYGTRNVITAVPMSKVSAANGPDALSIDEIQVPLFQTMKSAMPLVVHKLNTLFFQPVFDNQNDTIPLTNPETFSIEYVKVPNRELERYTTISGLEEIIDDFRAPENQNIPVSITTEKGDYYLALVYDDEDEIFMFNDEPEFRNSYYPRRFRFDPNDPIPEYFPKRAVLIGGTSVLRGFGVKYDGCGEVTTGFKWIGYCPDEIFDNLDDNWTTVDPATVSTNVKPPRDGKVRGDTLLIPWRDTGFCPFSIPGKHVVEEDLKKGCFIKDDYWIADPMALLHLNGAFIILSPTESDRLMALRYDRDKVRPLTQVEMCYIATWSAVHNKCCTSTRHPVLVIENIQVYHTHLISTNPSRRVYLKTADSNAEGTLLPEYPILGAIVKTSLSPHPATLDKYDADFDGDVLGLNILMSDEANEEINKFINSKTSLVDANGNLIYGLGDGRMCKFALTACTYYDVSEDKK